MLSKIIILNSSVYGKAQVKLDDCDSIQFVGPNNIGKSTLIYALNFLFVIDGKKMSFSGNRIGDKETIHHYFPQAHNSFVIFEIFKQRNYCFLLKRNADGEVEYYRFDHSYDDKFFFRADGERQRLLTFEEVNESLVSSGVALHEFKTKTEVFNFVYRRGKKNDGTVWLDDSVKSDGISNNFSKIYRYLINTKLITNRTLKEALIISDNREDEGLNFSHRSRKEINDLLKINEEIRSLRVVQKDFENFQELLSQYKAQIRNIGELLFTFNTHYTTTLTQHEEIKLRWEVALRENSYEINEILKPREREIIINITKLDTELTQLTKNRESIEKELRFIQALDPIDFLKQQLSNLEEARREIESHLTRITRSNLSRQHIEKRIQELKDQTQQYKNQIAGYEHQVIHNLTDKLEDREKLNYILSPEFSSLSKELIKQKISHLDDIMNLFDGKIELPGSLPRKAIPSLENLREVLTNTNHELTEFEQLHAIAIDIQKSKITLASKEAEIRSIKEKIARHDNKSNLEHQLQTHINNFSRTEQEKSSLEKDERRLQEELARKSTALEKLKEDIKQQNGKITTLRNRKSEIDLLTYEPLQSSSTESLNEVYFKIMGLREVIETHRNKKDRLFDLLKLKLKITIADEEEFVKFVEDEINCLTDKEKSIDGLLQSISTQFANPAISLIRRFEEFREYVYNKFNTKLGKVTISNLQGLKIQLTENKSLFDEIRKIGHIQDLRHQLAFDADQSENLKTLNAFLDSGRKINFEDLFDLKLHLTLKGKEKVVDLKDQIESDGTDKMIRMVIVMIIINRLAITDEKNRIALFIDEVGTIDDHNRPLLVKFANEHNFIPIFAAPQPFDGFDKYYYLFRPPADQKLNISEESVITRETLEQ